MTVRVIGAKMTYNTEIHDFTLIFKQYSNRFIAFAATYVGNRSTAEDIVMDAFLYYWERRSSMGENPNPPAYILTTIKHKCLNHLRNQTIQAKARQNIASINTQALKVRITTLEALDPEEIFSEEIKLAVRQAIEALPYKTREIFLLSRIHGKTYKEIAEELSLTVKSVEFEISKANRILRSILKDPSHYLSLLVALALESTNV